MSRVLVRVTVGVRVRGRVKCGLGLPGVLDQVLLLSQCLPPLRHLREREGERERERDW